MAPRESRISSAVSFEPLSGQQAERLRQEIQAKSSTPAAYKPGPSAAKKAAEEKAAAKKAAEERQEAAKTGWVTFVCRGEGLNFAYRRYQVKAADGLTFDGTLDSQGGGHVPKLKPGKVKLKVAVPAPTVEPEELTVLLADADGDPLAYADYLLEDGSGTKVRGETDANGRLYQPQLDAGKWKLQVVEAGPKGRSLSLQLVDPSGQPLANAGVTLSRASGTAASLRTDSDGRVDAHGLKPGAWTLRVETP